MKNTIEHHAVILALLGKYAILYGQEAGKEALLEGIKRVGKERGTRMAARAAVNGDELNFVNYMAYGEWKAMPGEMEFDMIPGEEAVQNVFKCPWNDNWKKHGLLEYGKYFCLPIDKALFSSFNYEFRCDVTSNLSWDADKCHFEWHQKLGEEELAALAAKKSELGDSCIRDFDFHVAHVLYSVGAELEKRLGEPGKRALESAKEEFVSIFGSEYLEAAAGKYPAAL